MASVRFKISKRVQNGRGEILVRFVAGRGVDVQTGSLIFVPVDKWNDATGVLSVSTRYATPDVVALIETKKRLDALQSAIMDAYFADPLEATTRDWLVGVVDRFHNPNAGQHTDTPIADVVAEYIERNAMSDGTRKQYAVIQRMLARFSAAVRPVFAETIQTADLDAFAAYMAKETTDGRTIERGHNTISSKMKKLRSVCKWATMRGIMPRNPFNAYTIKSEIYGTPIFLHLDERDAIAAFDGLTPAQAVQRDIFIFQCHVGCRVSDLYTFTHANVVVVDGVAQLQYIQRKLRNAKPQTISVPLDDVALSLIERYKDADPARLFPFISKDKYNDTIKRVIRAAGIDRKVVVQDPVTMQERFVPIYEMAASHMARKTFTANLYKITHSERIVSSMSGHSPNSVAIYRYLLVDDEIKLDALKQQETASGRNPTTRKNET